MAKRYLSRTVQVRDSDGALHTFIKGDVPPDWAKAQITNPNVWTDRSEAESGSDDGSDSADGEYGSGPWKGRTAGQVRALATRLGYTDHTNRDEAIAWLEAEGVSAEAPAWGDTPVEA